MLALPENFVIGCRTLKTLAYFTTIIVIIAMKVYSTDTVNLSTYCHFRLINIASLCRIISHFLNCSVSFGRKPFHRHTIGRHSIEIDMNRLSVGQMSTKHCRSNVCLKEASRSNGFRPKYRMVLSF